MPPGGKPKPSSSALANLGSGNIGIGNQEAWQGRHKKATVSENRVLSMG
jgi:hypothetical protein